MDDDTEVGQSESESDEKIENYVLKHDNHSNVFQQLVVFWINMVCVFRPVTWGNYNHDSKLSEI